MSFAQNLEFAMKATKTTNYKMAKDLVLSQTSIANWLSGGIKPHKKTRVRIAEYFGTTLEKMDCDQPLSEIDIKKPVPIWDGKNKERLLSAIKSINDMDLLLYVLDEVNKKIQEINKNDK